MTHRATTLEGGLTVVTERMADVRSASIGFWVGTGSVDEPGAQAGASHFLEHLLFKGTEERSARSIAVAVDSVPADSDGVLMENVDRRFPFASFATARLAQVGARMYYFDGCYQRDAVCETSKRVDSRDVLLLAGVAAPEFQETTSKLAKCFAPTNRLQSKTDLSPSGYSIINASMEQSEVYDQRLIDFFKTSLGGQ